MLGNYGDVRESQSYDAVLYMVTSFPHWPSVDSWSNGTAVFLGSRDLLLHQLLFPTF